MSRILVAEDDHRLRHLLTVTLEAHGHEVVPVRDGRGALDAATQAAPDLFLLDLGLPDMDGAQVIARLREWCAGPVLVLSAREGEAEKVRMLDMGADDYLTKPFGVGELLARMRVALRRTRRTENSPLVANAAFRVDLADKRVRGSDGTEIRLTPTEWAVLEVLARQPGALVSHREMLAQVWGDQYQSETHYLRIYMGQLRRKLEPDPAQPRYLLTEPGRGYRLRTEE